MWICSYCTAAPDGNCAVHAHAARPCGAWLATSALLHLALAGVSDSRRNFGGSSQNEAGSDRNRQLSGDAVPFRSYEGQNRRKLADLPPRALNLVSKVG